MSFKVGQPEIGCKIKCLFSMQTPGETKTYFDYMFSLSHLPPVVVDLKVLLLPKLLLEAIEPLPLLLVLNGDAGGRIAVPKSLTLFVCCCCGCRPVATVTYSTLGAGMASSLVVMCSTGPSGSSDNSCSHSKLTSSLVVVVVVVARAGQTEVNSPRQMSVNCRWSSSPASSR